MPPPTPYNLNRWIVVGGVALMVTGFFATRRGKPVLEFEKAGPEPAPVVSSDAIVDTAADSADVAPAREVGADQARFEACFDGVYARADHHSRHMKALQRLNLRLHSPFGARLSHADAADECEKIGKALDAGLEPPIDATASKKPCPAGSPICE